MARWKMVALVTCALLGCAPNHQFTDPGSTVMALASIDPEISTFISMVTTCGMDAKLRAGEPVTVLAPNNKALDLLGPERIRFLMNPEGSAELSELVKAYIFPGAFSAEDVARGKLPHNLLGKKVAASKADDGTPRVQGTGKILVSMKGSNGFVHVIDVVIP